MNRLEAALAFLVMARLEQRYRKVNDRKEWALVTREPDKRTGHHRVLYWFGADKPPKEKVLEQERRVQYFKHHG